MIDAGFCVLPLQDREITGLTTNTVIQRLYVVHNVVN